MNNDIVIGVVGAVVVHGMAFFLKLPTTPVHYEVMVSPSVLEVSLVQRPLKQTEAVLEKPIEKILKNPVETLPPLKPVDLTPILKDTNPSPSQELWVEKPKEEIIKEPIHESNEELLPLIQETQAIIEPTKSHVVTADVKPLTSRNRPPKYPKEARLKGWEGRVIFNVLVNQQGKVQSIKILQSSGYDVLDQEAQKTIESWLFEPALFLGHPIEKNIEIPVRFRLEDH